MMDSGLNRTDGGSNLVFLTKNIIALEKTSFQIYAKKE